MSDDHKFAEMASSCLSTPIGYLQSYANDEHLKAVLLSDTALAERPSAVSQLAYEQLNAYFHGSLKSFDLPLDADGTEFQKQVWQQLTTIEYAKTASYQDIAIGINKPTATRAVGAANGKNPLTIIVPCHRIIGRSGALTGYASGIARKQFLLELEQKNK